MAIWLSTEDTGRTSPGHDLRRLAGWSALLLLGLGALLAVAWDSVALMVHDWFAREEYSYALLIPGICAYLLHTNRGLLLDSRPAGFAALGLCLFGLLLIVLGRLATIHAISQYGFVIGLIGLCFVLFGRAATSRPLVFVFIMLLFMVPLPHFLHQTLSGELQLISSELGARMIRLVGISVYVHGNVIDLGAYKLQVVEACDGLRYLFPLAALGYVFALLYRGPMWQRVLLFVSTVPLTVLMNSVRIAMIGVAYQYGGVDLADGFLHDFQGWSVFMVCVVILLLEVRLVATLSGRRESLIDLLAPEGLSQQRAVAVNSMTSPDWSHVVRPDRRMFAATSLLVVAALGIALLPAPDSHLQPARRDLLEFPLEIGDGWTGRRQTMDLRYVETLGFSDYIVADFARAENTNDLGNLYVAYYASQLSGQSAHSPRTCIPGDGWEIVSFERTSVAGPDGQPHPVNRALIRRGNAQQLVYYWFEQRGRTLSNEYLVKWYIFLDSLRKGRTDGALVRIMTPVLPGESPELVERRLQSLYAPVRDLLPEFVPGP